MIFYVNVPVLSVNTSLAPPIVSAASRRLTKLFSYFIYPTEYARLSVTANGSPSGTATTIIVIERIKAFISAFVREIVRMGSLRRRREITAFAANAINVNIAT